MKSEALNSILIFTDGACSGNPGPGGWAAVIVTPDGQIQELGGHKDHTTNNEMELLAAIQSLQKVRGLKVPVMLYTDSTYVIRGISQWIWGWKKKGWKTADGKEVSHQKLWEILLDLTLDRKADCPIQWLYSRGHVGTPGNERCDEIAVAFSHKRWVELYEGPLLEYSVAIYDLPEDSSLPEQRPKQEKKVAHSYLSCLGGVVIRHKEWSACEKRVKGQSGARFKKAMSDLEEKEILKAWGLSETSPIKES